MADPLSEQQLQREERLRAAVPRLHMGHSRKITALAWSSTGHLLATGSQDQTIRTWPLDAQTGALRRAVDVLRGHAGTIDALCWSPTDAHVLASGAADRTVRLWDARGGGAAAVTPGGKAAASGGGGGGSSKVDIKGQALSMAWSCDGNLLCVGTRDDALNVIDGRRGVVLHVHQFAQELNEFAFTPSGLLYCALGNRGVAVDEGQVGVFRLVPPAATAAPASAPSAAAPAAATAPAATAAVAATAAASVIAFSSSSAPSLLSGSTATVASGAAAAAPPAGAAAAMAAAAAGRWSLVEVVRVRGHTTPVVVLRFAPSFRVFATGAGDSLVGLWDSGEVACLRTVDRADAQIRGVSFTHTGEHLAVAAGDRDDSAKVLDVVRVSDGSRVRSLPLREGGINFLAWAPHAQLLAFALDDAGAAKPQPPASALAQGALAVASEAGALRILVAT